jgi:3-isopropylmalate dehydrogenase
MMLRYTLDLADQASMIEDAVSKVLDKGLRTPDIMAEGCREVGTVEMGDAVLAELSA